MPADVEHVEALAVDLAAQRNVGPDGLVAEHEDELAVVPKGHLGTGPVEATKQAVADLALEHEIEPGALEEVVEEIDQAFGHDAEK